MLCKLHKKILLYLSNIMQSHKRNVVLRISFRFIIKMFVLLSLALLTLYDSAQSNVDTHSLARTMFLPPDAKVNPFYDPEIEYLAASFNNNTPSLGQSRTSSTSSLFSYQ
jgi:hypothetical protein